jgi:hypothetical protein
MELKRGRQCAHVESRRVALALLSRGLCSPGQIARVLGLPRQVVEHWARGLDWRKIQLSRLMKAYRKERDRGQVELGAGSGPAAGGKHGEG